MAHPSSVVDTHNFVKVSAPPCDRLELCAAACAVIGLSMATLGDSSGAKRSVAGSGIGSIPPVPGGTLKLEPISSWRNSNKAGSDIVITIQKSRLDGRGCSADQSTSADAMMAVQG